MCFLQSLVRLVASAFHTIHKTYKHLIPNLGQFLLHGTIFLILLTVLILLANRALRRYERYRRAWSNLVLDDVKDDIGRLKAWYSRGIEGVEVDGNERGRERDLEAQWDEEIRLDGERQSHGANSEGPWEDVGREDRSESPEIEDKLQKKEDAESDWEKTESVSSWSEV